MRFTIFLYMAAVLFTGCSSADNRNAAPEEKGLQELERAIEAIEDRRNAELRIVEEQTEMRDVLRGNVEKANSKGMREKIERDLRMKEISIERAKRNLANQDSLLNQLRYKRDSLSGVASGE